MIICVSASIPAWMCLWLARKQVHANTHSSACSLLFPIPRFIHFTIVCPCWGCWALVDNSIFEAYCAGTRLMKTFPLFDYNSVKHAVQFTFLDSSISQHICPKPWCSLVHCIGSQTNSVFRNTIPIAVHHQHISIEAKNGFVQMTASYCLYYCLVARKSRRNILNISHNDRMVWHLGTFAYLLSCGQLHHSHYNVWYIRIASS